MRRIIMLVLLVNFAQIEWLDWAARVLLQLARFAQAADISAAQAIGAESPFTSAMWQGIRFVLDIPDPTPAATLTPTLYPTLSPVPVTPATLMPDVCVASPVSEINLRAGPGTSFAVVAVLPPLARVELVAQATSSAGFTWYQTSAGGWLREDVVSLVGACARLTNRQP